MLVNGHYSAVPRRYQRKDNVQRQISGRILPQMQSIVFIILQPFTQNAVSKIWGYYTDTPQFLLGNIQSRNAFRSIDHERKYLMHYKECHASGIVDIYMSDFQNHIA